MDEEDYDMTHDAGYAALVGIDWADTKHDFCLRATGADQEEYGVMGICRKRLTTGPEPWRRNFRVAKLPSAWSHRKAA
jgi:hypothetical protein